MVKIDYKIVATIIHEARPSYIKNLMYTKGNEDARHEIARKLSVYFKSIDPDFHNESFILRCFPDFDSTRK